MAAVTQNARPFNNVNGAVREYYQNITVVTTGDTLAIPFRTVYELTTNNTSITAMSAATSGSGSTVTFTGTGADLLFTARGV